MTNHHLGDYMFMFLGGSLPQVGFSLQWLWKSRKQVYFSDVSYMYIKVFGMWQLVQCRLFFKMFLLKSLFLFVFMYLYGWMSVLPAYM